MKKKGWFRQIIVIISDRYLYLLWLKRIFLYINVYVFSLLAFINSNTGHLIFFYSLSFLTPPSSFSPTDAHGTAAPVPRNLATTITRTLT